MAKMNPDATPDSLAMALGIFEASVLSMNIEDAENFLPASIHCSAPSDICFPRLFKCLLSITV